ASHEKLARTCAAPRRVGPRERSVTDRERQVPATDEHGPLEGGSLFRAEPRGHEQRIVAQPADCFDPPRQRYSRNERGLALGNGGIGLSCVCGHLRHPRKAASYSRARYSSVSAATWSSIRATAGMPPLSASHRSGGPAACRSARARLWGSPVRKCRPFTP